MSSQGKQAWNTAVITKIQYVEAHPKYKQFYVLWQDSFRKKWCWETEKNVKKNSLKLYNDFMQKWNSDYYFKSKVTFYNVESVLSERMENGKRYYKVKWVGYKETSWEPEESLKGSSKAVEQFKRKKQKEEKNKHAGGSSNWLEDSLARSTVLKDLSRIKSAEFCLPWTKSKKVEDSVKYCHAASESSLPATGSSSTISDPSLIKMKDNSAEDLPLHICEDIDVSFSGEREAPNDPTTNDKQTAEDFSHDEFDVDWETLDLRLSVEREINSQILKEGGLFENAVYEDRNEFEEGGNSEDLGKCQSDAETFVTFEFDDNESLDLTLPID